MKYFLGKIAFFTVLVGYQCAKRLINFTNFKWFPRLAYHCFVIRCPYCLYDSDKLISYSGAKQSKQHPYNEITCPRKSCTILCLRGTCNTLRLFQLNYIWISKTDLLRFWIKIGTPPYSPRPPCVQTILAGTLLLIIMNSKNIQHACEFEIKLPS